MAGAPAVAKTPDSTLAVAGKKPLYLADFFASSQDGQYNPFDPPTSAETLRLRDTKMLGSEESLGEPKPGPVALPKTPEVKRSPSQFLDACPVSKRTAAPAVDVAPAPGSKGGIERGPSPALSSVACINI